MRLLSYTTVVLLTNIVIALSQPITDTYVRQSDLMLQNLMEKYERENKQPYLEKFVNSIIEKKNRLSSISDEQRAIYLGNIALAYNAGMTNSRLLTDSVAILTCLQLLSDNNASVRAYVAHDVLWMASYTAFQKYNKHFLGNVSVDTCNGDILALYVLSKTEELSEKPDSIRSKCLQTMRDSLSKTLAYQKRYEVLALLGDTIAENRLVAEYNTTTNFKEKERLIRQLVYVGTNKTIHTVLKSFNAPIIDKNAFDLSIRIPIIRELRRRYPDVSLLQEFDLISVDSDTLLQNEEWAHNYIEKTLRWIHDTFGVTPTGAASNTLQRKMSINDILDAL